MGLGRIGMILSTVGMWAMLAFSSVRRGLERFGLEGLTIVVGGRYDVKSLLIKCVVVCRQGETVLVDLERCSTVLL